MNGLVWLTGAGGTRLWGAGVSMAGLSSGWLMFSKCLIGMVWAVPTHIGHLFRDSGEFFSQRKMTLWCLFLQILYFSFFISSLFYGIQVCISARRVSGLIITNEIQSLTNKNKWKCRALLLVWEIFLLWLSKLNVFIYNEKSGGRDSPTCSMPGSYWHACKIRVFTGKLVLQIFPCSVKACFQPFLKDLTREERVCAHR